MSRTKESLARKLLWRIAPLVLLILVAAQFVGYIVVKRKAAQDLNRLLEAKSEHYAAVVSELFQRYADDLETLSETPLIADYYNNTAYGLVEEAAQDRRQLEVYFQRFLKRSIIYLGIRYLDARGRMVSAVGAEPASPLIRYSKTVASPAGEVMGRLILDGDPEAVARLLDHARFGEKGGAYLADPGGRLVIGRRDLEGLGVKMRKAVPGCDWTLVLAADEEEFLSSLKRVQWISFLVSLAAVGLILAAMVVGIKSGMASLQPLMSAIERLSAGDFSREIAVRGDDEIAAVSAAFNGMTRGLRRAQAALVQSEKLSAIGQLIAGIAHEISNPLAAVVGYAQLIMMGKVPAALREDLTLIRENAGRCKKIVDNLLLFARPGAPTRRPVRLGEAVANVRALMRYRLEKRDNVRVELDLDPSAKPILGDLHRLEQVFINLFNNACDALHAATGERRLIVRGRQQGDRLRVEVSDNGPGIEARNLDRLFEPFFTTKPAGQGTGLGLAITRQIVEEHGGRISCESAPGRGTTFVLFLPTLDGDARPAESAAAPPPRPGKRVLVVEDEPDLARVVAELLKKDGDEATVAPGGAEALKRLEAGSYDLIITDLALGEVSGDRIIAAWRERHQGRGARLLLITGDILNQSALELIERAGVEWLAKPFDLEELRATIRRLLS